MKKFLEKIAKAQSSVVGINRRNIEFIYPNNLRKDYRFADDKVLCKELLEKEKIPVPRTYEIVEHLWDLNKKLLSLEDLEYFVVKPAMGSGGNGILILQKQPGGLKVPSSTQ